MPIITIDSNKLTINQKRDLVASLTESASKILNLPMNTITVLIREMEPENVGVGGLLLGELKKQVHEQRSTNEQI